jgi:hypothetical protein
VSGIRPIFTQGINMTVANNPLRQYFRRPAVHLKLPSAGKYYAPGVVNIPESGELPVFPMTAIDEITSKTPDALFNGSAMVEIIRSCIPDIKDPWAINNIDFDAVLIGIRASSNGSGLEVESACPKCKEVETFSVDLLNILAQMKPGDYDKEMSINELKVKFKPLTYKEMNQAGLAQFAIQREFAQLSAQATTDTEMTEEQRQERIQKGQNALKAVTLLTIEILVNTIEYIQTPTVKVTEKEHISDFLKNCDKQMYEAMRDFNAALKTQTDIKPLRLKCIHCQNEYEQPFTLNTSDFFG